MLNARARAILFEERSQFWPLAMVASEGCGMVGGQLAGVDTPGFEVLVRLAGRLLGRPEIDVVVLLTPAGFLAKSITVPNHAPHAGGYLLGTASFQDEHSWTPDIPELGDLVSKIGGRPGYLQHELREQNLVDEQGLEFMFQFCAESLPRDDQLTRLLCDGAVYAFAPSTADGFALEQAVVFWQRT